MKNLQGNIWKFTLYKALTSVFFSVPVFVLFWQSNGLNLTQVMLLQSIFAILVVVLEIPTGYFADRYGRKNTLIIATTMNTLALVIYSFGHNFFHFLYAEVLFAIGLSLSSGTASALIYDSLQELGQEQTYKKIRGNIMFYGMIVLAASNILGGFIGDINLRYTIYASVPFFALAIPVVAMMHEPTKNKKIIEKGHLKNIIQSLTHTIQSNKQLRRIMIYSGVIYAFNQAALRLYQPYFTLTGIDIIYFGIIFASFQLVAAFSSKYAHIVEKKLGQHHSLILLVVLVIVSYFLMGNIVMLFSFSFAFLHQFVRGFKNVVISDYVNKLTTSDMRATTLSVENFIGKGIYALIIPIFGWLADVYSLTQALNIIGITALVSGGILLWMMKKYKVL